MKKKSKKTGNFKKKTKKKKDDKVVDTKITEKKGGLTFEKMLVAILVIGVLAAAFKVVDYYTGWGNTEKVIKRRISAAEKYAIYKKHHDAIGVYESVIARWGKDEKYKDYVKQARLSLAKANKDAEKYLEAIKLYGDLIKEFKGVNNDMYAWRMIELGDTYNSIFNSDEAIKTYNKVISEFKDSDWAAEALFGIADAYKNKKDYKSAIGYYDRIVKKYKKGFLSAEALTNKGKIYEEMGKSKQALAVYTTVIKEFPEIVTEYARFRKGVLAGSTAK